MCEHDPTGPRDAVDRSFGPLCKLHDEQLRPAVLRQDLERLGEAHRDASRPLLKQLLRAVDRRVEDAEAARSRGEHGLEADGPVGIAELLGRVSQGSPSRHASPRGRANTDSLEQRIHLRLVVRASHRLRRRDEHRDAPAGETIACFRKAE